MPCRQHCKAYNVIRSYHHIIQQDKWYCMLSGRGTNPNYRLNTRNSGLLNKGSRQSCILYIYYLLNLHRMNLGKLLYKFILINKIHFCIVGNYLSMMKYTICRLYYNSCTVLKQHLRIGKLGKIYHRLSLTKTNYFDTLSISYLVGQNT